MNRTSVSTRVGVILSLCVSLAAWAGRVTASPAGQDDQPSKPTLTSSAYPPVPADVARLWLVPDHATKARATKTLAGFAQGVRLQADGKYAQALPLVSTRALADTPLADYAMYFRGVILLREGKTDEAQSAFDELRGREPVGYLSEAVRLREAETADARGDHQKAIQIYEELAARKTTAPDAVLMALAKSSEAAGDREKAARAYSRVYYEYPLSDQAAAASTALMPLVDALALDPAARTKMEATRAQRLFDAKRYPAAETAFQALLTDASGDDKERFSLRVAECEFYQRHYRQARDLAQPFTDHASRKAEAQFFYVSSIRELGQPDDYVRQARELAAEFGTSSWVEEILNNLASHFIVNNEDDRADQVFRELYAKFPKGHYAERAAWKVGWWAYKHSHYQDTVTYFESAAAAFPHSDSRPAYLYWSARAHAALGERDLASDRYRLVLTDYRNTYYGYLTAAGYGERHEDLPDIEPVAILDREPATAPKLPAAAEQIRLLLALDLTEQALDELQYAQRIEGDSAVVTATLAWARNADGDLRTGITLMKRAYPQYMAAGGDKLPVEIRKVMYPVDYWTSIKKEAATRHLDPYLLASLILQESTFSPSARSAADAVGLMQLLASTGRHYARSLRMRRFSPVMLTRADTNLRLGVAFYSDLVQRFGADHLALASYNAGEHRVAQWIAERPGLSREEFIDDIPYPETQNYVKRILAGAEEYKRLYGGAASTTASKPSAAQKKAVARTPVKRTTSKATSQKPTTKKKTTHARAASNNS